MLYSSFHDFARVEQGLLRKPSGDPMAVFNSLATTTSCTAYTCYALSCLGCCCCTKCAQTCIQQGDLAGTWKFSMDALYANQTIAQRRKSFLNAMMVLREIHMRLTHLMKQRVSIIQQSLNEGNALGYAKHEMSFLMLTQELDNGTWIQKVFKPVRNYLLNIPHTNRVLPPIVLTVYDSVHITPEMYRTLALALGFFLPTTQSPYGFSPLNAGEIATIQKVSI